MQISKYKRGCEVMEKVMSVNSQIVAVVADKYDTRIAKAKELVAKLKAEKKTAIKQVRNVIRKSEGKKTRKNKK